ncbi:MAG: trypsin-like peptidase domain-containing protein, partial [Planctomycetaceae bacterium]
MGERILRFVGQTFLPVWFHTPPALLAVSLLCVCFPNTVHAQDGLTLLRQLEATNIRIIEKAEPSVVAIARVRKDVPIEGGIEARLRGFDIGRTDRPGQKDFVPNDFGAGVIIDSKNPRHPRLILTNYHVVRGGPTFGQGNDDSKFELWVTTANRKSSRSTIIAADPHSDLAVITVGQLQPANLPALTPTTYTPRKGQFMFALGNPYTIAKDGSASATWGIVSNVARSKSLSQAGFEDQSRLFENVHQFGTLLQ